MKEDALEDVGEALKKAIQAAILNFQKERGFMASDVGVSVYGISLSRCVVHVDFSLKK